jgi:hypothetical protein
MWCIFQQRRAVVTLYKGNQAVGEIDFVQVYENGPVNLNGTIRGLIPGKHGLHVHETGNVRHGCRAVGSHFNPRQVCDLLQPLHTHTHTHARAHTHTHMWLAAARGSGGSSELELPNSVIGLCVTSREVCCCANLLTDQLYRLWSWSCHTCLVLVATAA